MLEIIKIWQSWEFLKKINQDLTELKTIQEKAQKIDCTLQKYMCKNKQEFSKLSEDSEDVALQFTVKMQENQIINNILGIEKRFDQLLENGFDQLTQQGEDGQLVHITNEHSSEVLEDTLIRFQGIVSRDYTQNKNFSEYVRGVPKRDFRLKKRDGYAIFFAVCEALSILTSIADKYMQSHVKDLAIQYEEEIKKTRNQLVELRRKTENYYRKFRPTKKKSPDRSFILSFIGFLALLFALLFGLLVLI